MLRDDGSRGTESGRLCQEDDHMRSMIAFKSVLAYQFCAAFVTECALKRRLAETEIQSWQQDK